MAWTKGQDTDEAGRQALALEEAVSGKVYDPPTTDGGTGGGWLKGAAPVSISGALSTVTDAAAKAVLTSIIAGLVALGLATDATT